jgi:uncharacterized surface protein with fasciclin (FAS1) repeats
MFLALVAILLLSLPLAAGAETTNGITAPKDGATVSGKVDVQGYAGAPGFKKWQLDVLPGGDANAAIFLALGEKPGEFSTMMDTTAFPNGEHALRLRVMRADSNYDEYINKFTIANGQAKQAAAPTAATKDIVATAIAAGQFKTLVAAVQAAGLVEALQGKGPFTVFAPTDAAFAKLPAGTVEGLLKDPKALSNILLYHVVPGEVKAAAVKDGMTAKTLQGSPVTFKVADGKVMINGANIIATDVMASNGVIHVIDSVILPPAAAAAKAAPAPMTNGITSLKEGAKVSGKVDVKGYASDPSFKKWQLDVLPGGDANAAIFLAAGEKPGEFSYAVDTTAFPNGDHALRLRVVRADSNYDETISKFTIANGEAKPAAATTAAATTAAAPTAAATAKPAPAAMSNGITSLKEGATVSGKADVKGYANDPSFKKWQLDVLPGGDANAAIFLAVGETPGEFSYTVDTMNFPNGEHALRLRVVRSDGNYDEYVTKFTVANR